MNHDNFFADKYKIKLRGETKMNDKIVNTAAESNNKSRLCARRQKEHNISETLRQILNTNYKDSQVMIVITYLLSQ